MDKLIASSTTNQQAHALEHHAKANGASHGRTMYTVREPSLCHRASPPYLLAIGRHMLRDVSPTISLVLALLLIVLTPVGTGQGAHRDQLLDPLVPHVHFADSSTRLLRSPQPVPSSPAAKALPSGLEPELLRLG